MAARNTHVFFVTGTAEIKQTTGLASRRDQLNVEEKCHY